MLTVTSRARQCGGLNSRRRFLQIGAATPLGLSLPALLQARALGAEQQADRSFGRAKQCIFVFLNGGPSQLDMWDMKPLAAADIRGELRPIATNVPGLQIGELLPLTAQQADKFQIVRSVTHECSVHTTGVYTMLTGTPHPTPQIDQTAALPQDHPHWGSIFGKWRGWTNRLPPFVTLPTLFRAPPVEGIWPGQNAGFLGRRYDPFVVDGDKHTAAFRIPAVELLADLPLRRMEDRRTLLRQIDRSAAVGVRGHEREDLDTFYEQAFSLIDSSRVVQAVDLERVPADVRDRYGRHLFGQGLLAARRLVETGIPLVTIYWIDPTPPGPGGGEYDSHGRIYHHMRHRLVPPTDRALAALFSDLGERRLLDETLVVVMGEFGRTPRINADAGRDHWPQVQSILLAGAGISGGRIFGASDRDAAYPARDPVTPADLCQTILHLLGVPSDLSLVNHEGRPVRACSGRAIPELLA